ncbi:tyrosine-type recombinase/integrase [Actinomycetospora rhizophila]|uniref:Tyrosine-type recombinase/integrase n=1 Tax=Actinomycetospora rhizophila TaxID=1416876 RepID=A0ABV9ZB64_9PSEU
MSSSSASTRRRRGTVQKLPSGSLRVRVYAGYDSVTQQRHYLTEVVPAGPKAAAQAEKVRTRLAAEVDAGRQPRTSATVAQLMERYLEIARVEPSTRQGYEGLVRNHIVPLLGDQQVGRVRGEVLDSFYAELRRCRVHCRRGRAIVDHRTQVEHQCDQRCRPHRCRPLGEGTIRHAHNLLNGAFSLAVRWEWVGTNPVATAVAPTMPAPNPEPPTASQAARIASEAWKDPAWGLFVWLAMTTGARRGELCALRWKRIDFGTGVLSIRGSIAEVGGRSWEKDTKTHQQRRIVLDAQTLALLRAFLVHTAEQAAALELALPEDGFVFSPSPDGSSWPKPGTATQRYSRMCARLGYGMHLHQLRHYSATELISGGVDIRTVAGRLGHGGGGVTTLRVYSAWVAEADQRASTSLAARMPDLPNPVLGDGSTPIGNPVLPTPPGEAPTDPYRKIAADLKAAMRCGVLKPGDELPTIKDLSAQYQVAFSTGHRAVALLAEKGLIVVSRGRRARVAGRR